MGTGGEKIPFSLWAMIWVSKNPWSLNSEWNFGTLLIDYVTSIGMWCTNARSPSLICVSSCDGNLRGVDRSAGAVKWIKPARNRIKTVFLLRFSRRNGFYLCVSATKCRSRGCVTHDLSQWGRNRCTNAPGWVRSSVNRSTGEFPIVGRVHGVHFRAGFQRSQEKTGNWWEIVNILKIQLSSSMAHCRILWNDIAKRQGRVIIGLQIRRSFVSKVHFRRRWIDTVRAMKCRIALSHTV